MRDLFISSLDKITDFPYGYSKYESARALENEYRSFKIKNYLMFYTINEDKKIVTIIRVLYKKMDFSNILE